ncbi:nucleotide sugar dehydrogenase [Vibrio splendidus]|uniref:nucleotide sugar dehydrogenase n=1 Tax=Vibrio splendidus TaxID=29497 RepID=UPI000D36A617|nr:nucleotide sugar dehydrogenase [Vibrio splendidus]PTO86003.1 Vi polysaccharide biosynthesis protein VipA/TviB [Vibrio splendidus]
MTMLFENVKIGVIGLGYVGLPLAIEFGKKYPTIGFDIDRNRVRELVSGVDSTMECNSEEVKETAMFHYTSSVEELKECNVYIVTVPTPIDIDNQPDLTPLLKASKMLGSLISKGDIVIYESTVYPGATEDSCIPEIEKSSGLKFNLDFYAGYSPERINPGDKERRLTNILKVTSGSTEPVAKFVDQLYGSIIKAGTYRASSIKVAESSKVIENVQRDVNIALINELYQIFNIMGISTDEVIEAASTKWNFMKLKPGLVGGHCISVDPYYLLHKSTSVGYIPDLIRTAREVNNSMPSFIANSFLKELVKSKISPIDCTVGLLGFTFKENCPDIRNTKVYDLYKSLLDMGFNVKVYDAWADKFEVKKHYNIDISNDLDNKFDVALLSVKHDIHLDFIGNIKDKFIYHIK